MRGIVAERLAIVGGDAAGMSAASAARRREPELDVMAFERGPYTSFSACGIPFFVGGLFDDSDRLVARSPDVPGVQRAEPARTIDAADRFRAALQRGGESAVVVGGGYIGLEMAEALTRRGLSLTLVEQAGQVMATLDEDMAAHVQDAAERVGIDVRLGAELQEVSEHAVRVDGEDLPADHVVMATGVRPATTLARRAGLELGESGALRVDDH